MVQLFDCNILRLRFYCLFLFLGESGEVCEIFQWKGTLEEDLKTNAIPFSEKEIVHIGEEISDVFIYTTRLCDVADINLGNAVVQLVGQIDPFFVVPHLESASRPWPNLNFDLISRSLEKTTRGYKSHRALCLDMQAIVGELCHIFSHYSDGQCQPGLKDWKPEDRLKLANKAANICILLICLSKMCNLSIGQCITDKYKKNDAKYPADLSKGSSAKYTAYTEALDRSKNQIKTKPKHLLGKQIEQRRQQIVISAIWTSFVVGFLFMR